MMKRLLSLILVLAMVIGIAVPAFAAEAATTPAPAETESTETPAVEEQPKKAEDNFWLEYLKEKNYVQGYPDGTDGLDKAITRAETATILVRAKDMEAEALASNNVKSKFSDMYIGHWANGYVNIASSAANNFIRGHKDGTFRPAANVTNAEAVTMIVRALGITKAEDDQLALNYPQSYIYKAKEMGLLENVTVTDYAAPATRETVFRLLYNLLMNDKYGNHTIVKGIFLENDRTESLLGDREMMLEIIELEQRANYVKESRDFAEKYSRGTNLKLTLPKDKAIVVDGEKDRRAADVEDLLGRVVYVTLDDRLKDKPEAVVQIKIDNTYDYKFGAADKKAKTFEVDGKEYTVELNEKITAKDERLFRTYLNNKDLTYADFATIKYGVDFARATIKNGKVVFIDAYSFDDIAPVHGARETDNKVNVYSDRRDGALELVDLGSYIIGYTEGKGFYRIPEAKAVVKDDVVHVYGKGGGSIVRQDSVVGGNFGTVLTTGGKYYGRMQGADTKYLIATKENWKPVYSTGGKVDGAGYQTLLAYQANSLLSPFEGKETTILKDIFGNMQLIKSGFDYVDNTALVYEHLTRGDIRFLLRDNKLVDLKEDWRTNVLENRYNRDGYYDKTSSTIAAKLGSLNRADLVYTIGEVAQSSNYINRIATWGEMSKPYAWNETGKPNNWYGYATVTDKSGRHIVVKPEGNVIYKQEATLASQQGTNTTVYSILPRTNVFFVSTERNLLRASSPTDIKKDDKVVVISDYELDRILNTFVRNWDPGSKVGFGRGFRHYYNPYSDSKEIANTIVVVHKADLELAGYTMTVKLLDRVSYTQGTTITQVKGKFADLNPGKDRDKAVAAGATYERPVNVARLDYQSLNHLRDTKTGNIYDFVESNEAEGIFAVKPVITNNDYYRVLDVNEGRDVITSFNRNKLLLEDGNGDRYTVWMRDDAKVWGILTTNSIIRVDNEIRAKLVPDTVGAHRVSNYKEIYRPEFKGSASVTDKNTGYITAIDVVNKPGATANRDMFVGEGLYDVLGFGNVNIGTLGVQYVVGQGPKYNFGNPFVDVYPKNENERRLLSRFLVEEKGLYAGRDQFYRLPLADSRYFYTPGDGSTVIGEKLRRVYDAIYGPNYDIVWVSGIGSAVYELNPHGVTVNTAAQQAADYKSAYAPVFALSTATVTAADKVAVESALNAYNRLPVAVQANLTAQKAHLDALLSAINNTPAPQVSATAVKGMKVLGIQQYDITLVGAVAKDVNNVVGYSANGQPLANALVFDKAYYAADNGNKIQVRNPATPNLGDYAVLTVGTQQVTVVLEP